MRLGGRIRSERLASSTGRLDVCGAVQQCYHVFCFPFFRPDTTTPRGRKGGGVHYSCASTSAACLCEGWDGMGRDGMNHETAERPGLQPNLNKTGCVGRQRAKGRRARRYVQSGAVKRQTNKLPCLPPMHLTLRGWGPPSIYGT